MIRRIFDFGTRRNDGTQLRLPLLVASAAEDGRKHPTAAAGCAIKRR